MNDFILLKSKNITTKEIINQMPELNCNYCNDFLNTIIQKRNQGKNTNINIKTICNALSIIKKYHANQKRLSGEPFYSHPIAVATMLSQYTFHTNSITAALLHDVIEDTACTLEEIKFIFNEKIAKIVSRLTKLDDYINFKLSQEEILYKIMGKNSKSTENKEVILIKLLDRLHNLQTITHLPEKKQRLIASQTLYSYIPLAKYIGIETIEAELFKLISKILFK